MPNDAPYFLETPMKGQSPRNFTRTKLFTNTVLIRIKAYSRITGSLRFKE